MTPDLIQKAGRSAQPSSVRCAKRAVLLWLRTASRTIHLAAP